MTAIPPPVTHKNPPPQGIVCKPLSSADTNGFGNEPLQFLRLNHTEAVKPTGTYERDVDGNYFLQTGSLATSGDSVYVNTNDKVYARRELPDQLKGGNCYWERDSDGLVLSWEGPHGFYFAPSPLALFAGNVAPNIPGLYNKNKINNITITIDSVSITRDVTTYERFSNQLFCHGVIISAPGTVLGACMVEDVMVVAVESGNLDVALYQSKLSELLTTGWQLIDTLTLTDTAAITYLRKDHIFAFSDDGLSFCTMVRTVNETLLIASIDFAFFRTSKAILRGTLIFNNGAFTASQFSIEHVTDWIDATRTATFNETVDPVDPFHFTGDNSSSVASPNTGRVYAIGYIGNIETLCQDANLTITDTSSETWDLNNPGFGGVTWGSRTKTASGNYSVDLQIGGVTLFTSTNITSASVNLSSANDFLISGTESSSQEFDAYIPVFIDINHNSIVCIREVLDINLTITVASNEQTSTENLSTSVEFTTNIVTIKKLIYSASKTVGPSTFTRSQNLGGSGANLTTPLNFIDQTFPLFLIINELTSLINGVSTDASSLVVQTTGKGFDSVVDNVSFDSIENFVISDGLEKDTSVLFDIAGTIAVNGLRNANSLLNSKLFKI